MGDSHLYLITYNSDRGIVITEIGNFVSSANFKRLYPPIHYYSQGYIISKVSNTLEVFNLHLHAAVELMKISEISFLGHRNIAHHFCSPFEESYLMST